MDDTSVPQNPSNSPPSVPFLTRFIATGMFSGYSPFAPGTAGSIVGLLLYLIPGMEQPLVLSIAIVLTFIIGTRTSAVMEKHFGEDPSIVVIDEVVGMWISLLFLPRGLMIGIAAFFFFRLYDIIKPPPARQLERLKNGWGVMMDDVAAGIYANATVWIIRFVFPNWF
jgi:phosphatidylglycerophosphatase A